MSSPSSQQAIQALRRVFSTHGLPQILVSDNGAAFSSSEFQTFVTRNGFKHVRSAPYHPATNGLAERAIQTVKDALILIYPDFCFNIGSHRIPLPASHLQSSYCEAELATAEAEP